MKLSIHGRIFRSATQRLPCEEFDGKTYKLALLSLVQPSPFADSIKMKLENSYFVIATILCVVDRIRSRDAPIVDIPDQGQISGHFFNMFRTQKIVGYLGIPYAMPPIDDRRFAPPVVEGVAAWQGVRNGSQAPLQCWSDLRKPIKNHDDIFYKILNIDPKAADASQFSEDCLYLNIYVPDGK